MLSTVDQGEKGPRAGIEGTSNSRKVFPDALNAQVFLVLAHNLTQHTTVTSSHSPTTPLFGSAASDSNPRNTKGKGLE